MKLNATRSLSSEKMQKKSQETLKTFGVKENSMKVFKLKSFVKVKVNKITLKTI